MINSFSMGEKSASVAEFGITAVISLRMREEPEAF